jgi:hypothetical protein
MSNQNLREYKVCYSAVSVLASMCAGSENKIIDLLTGYLWDEEEAGSIKKASGPTNKQEQLPSSQSIFDLNKSKTKGYPSL